MPAQGSWEFPHHSSSLLYAAKFTADKSTLERIGERAAEGSRVAGVEGAIAGGIEALAEEATGSMDLWFQNGRVYSFFDVPQSVYRGLLDAASPGSYYHANIKDQYVG